jgi:hypothetical protein
VSDLESIWELVGTNPSAPLKLYTKVGLPFDASDVTIPFQAGIVLEGAAPFNIYLDEGLGANDPLVGIGQDRTLTVTSPAPSSVVLMGLGAMTILLATAWRRWRLGNALYGEGIVLRA